MIIFGIVWSLGKETYRKYQIKKEIATLQSEANRIVQENQTIQERIEYLESRDYQEKEAKDKLNLKGPGEEVVVVKPEVLTSEKTVEMNVAENLQSETTEKSIPNPIKWWRLFFGKK